MSDEWEAYTQSPPIRPEPATIHTLRGLKMQALKLEDVKEGLKRIMPVIETVTRLTPNKIDDAAVVFLKALLADEQKLAAAISGTE